MDARALQIDIADQHASEMRGVRDAAAGKEGDRADDQDEVLRRDREDEIQVDRPVRKVQSIREQQAEDRTGRADRCRTVNLLREFEGQQANQDGKGARSHPGHEVVFQEVARAPRALELSAEHPQRQHVDDEMADARVHEHVRDGLPQPELTQRELRHQSENGVQVERSELRGQEHRHVGGDQRFQSG